MLQRLRKRFNREEGFTLIELLVVILIIGILAAIAIPSFLNQTDKGTDAEAKATARTAQTAAETYFTDRGSYEGLTAEALNTIESQVPDTIDAGPTGTNNDGYTIAVESETGTTFTIAKTGDGVVARTCAPVGGGCPEGDSAVEGGEW